MLAQLTNAGARCSCFPEADNDLNNIDVHHVMEADHYMVA